MIFRREFLTTVGIAAVLGVVMACGGDDPASAPAAAPSATLVPVSPEPTATTVSAPEPTPTATAIPEPTATPEPELPDGVELLDDGTLRVQKAGNGVMFDGEHLWVTRQADATARKYTLAGEMIGSFKIGRVLGGDPIFAQGHMWAPDFDAARIGKVTLDGERIDQIDVLLPGPIAFDGEAFWVGSGSALKRFTPDGLKLEAPSVESAVQVLSFDDGSMWVGELKGRISRYGLDGVLLSTFDLDGVPVAITPDGQDVWVVTNRTHEAIKYSDEGVPLLGVGSELHEFATGAYKISGSIWVGSTNQESGSLQQLDASGQITGELLVPAQLNNVAFDGEHIWVTTPAALFRLPKFGSAAGSSSAPPDSATSPNPEPPAVPPITIGTIREFPSELLSSSPKLTRDESVALWEAFLSDIRVIGGDGRNMVIDLCSELDGTGEGRFRTDHTGYLFRGGNSFVSLDDELVVGWTIQVSPAARWNEGTLLIRDASTEARIGGGMTAVKPPTDQSEGPSLLGGNSGDLVLELSGLPDSACSGG